MATAWSDSTSCCTADCALPASPPSSMDTTCTGWHAMPPAALVAAAHTLRPGWPAPMAAPMMPLNVPTWPYTMGEPCLVHGCPAAGAAAEVVVAAGAEVLLPVGALV